MARRSATRSSARDRTRNKQRLEKGLEDAQIKVSSVIADVPSPVRGTLPWQQVCAGFDVRVSEVGAEQYCQRVTGMSGRGWFEADDLRRVVPVFSLAFGLVAAITQPSSAADIALAAVPVAAFSVWAFGRGVPLSAVSVPVLVPVVVAQRSGQLEPLMFNACLLSFAAGRWSASLAAAASLGLLAVITPVLVALVQDPAEVAVGIWLVAMVFVWVVGRAVARQERLLVELDGARRLLAEQALVGT